MNHHDDLFIWDSHAGFELKTVEDLETLSIWKEAGVDFLSVNVGYDVNEWQQTIRSLSLARDWLARTEGYQLVGTIDALDRARAAGDLAVAFDIEGMNALDGLPENVRLYHDLGVRQMLFAYNLNNRAGGGCHDEDVGLSSFGRTVVAEMNAVGMLVDCSHCGYRTTMEAMEISVDPVVFSHSNARTLHDHERNITDEQAVRCAATGGVVGVNGISAFLGENAPETALIVDHIEHYLDLIGPDHVGIGLDYFHEEPGSPSLNETISCNARFWPRSQYPGIPIRCAAPARLRDVADEMRRRRHEEGVIRAVLGGNFRRVAASVWR